MERKFTLTTSILKEWHKKFNALYFDNELPMPSFKITNATTFLGKCTYRDNLITMSIHRDRTEREFQNTFIHEMIHQWQWATNKFGDCHNDRGHGYWFKLKAYEINRKGGWEIQRCSDTHGASVASGMQKARRIQKDFNQTYLFIWNTNNGQKLWRHIRPTCLNNLRAIVESTTNGFYQNTRLYKIPYGNVLKSRYREAVSSLGGYNYDKSKAFVDNLIAQGEFVSYIK